MDLRFREKLGLNQWTGKNGKTKSKDACCWFNKGLCTKEASCKYEHRCTIPDCGKFGHSVHICHKRLSAGGNDNLTEGSSQGGPNFNKNSPVKG